MEPLLYHLYSGQMLFSAAFVVAAAAAASLAGVLDRSAFSRSAAAILSLAAIFAAAMSGAPMPLVQAFVAGAAVAAFALFGIVAPPARRRLLAAGALVAVACCAATEARWHFGHLTLPSPRRLIVIGDSLSSGGFGETSPWPRLIALDLRAAEVNLALPGETAGAALRNQLPAVPPPLPGDTVIVAIGGNDMLEGLPAGAFEDSLDALITSARAGGTREVVVLELPVVPGAWRFGAIQRRLATKHGVALVPKRVLAGVLLEPGCTYDGLHPTQRGHERLAEEIRGNLGW